MIFVLITCLGCEWKMKLQGGGATDNEVTVERYDRVQGRYLTTGDFSALQQMNMVYPMQTRTLIEDVLRIGYVNDPEINSKFLNFYQDTTLQTLINEVEFQYADMDDINKELTKAFGRLRTILPDARIPKVYAQIGSLDQSIIVGNGILGISLDKYLGAGYELYRQYYPQSQRVQMVRSMIVPDCMLFYLLSLFPVPPDMEQSQLEHDIHIGKIQWAVNRIIGRGAFSGKYVDVVERYMRKNKDKGVTGLLRHDNCSEIAAY